MKEQDLAYYLKGFFDHAYGVSKTDEKQKFFTDGHKQTLVNKISQVEEEGSEFARYLLGVIENPASMKALVDTYLYNLEQKRLHKSKPMFSRMWDSATNIFASEED